MPRVSIHLVTWNSRKYIRGALASILAQTYRDYSVLVIDNASTDGTLDEVRQEFPTIGMLRNFKNQGFAKAHNQGLALLQSHSVEDQLVLVTNPDILMEPDCLQQLVAAIDRRKEFAGVCPKLRRVRDGAGESDAPDCTDVLDSVGLRALKSRRFVDRGSGEVDHGQYDRSEEVFGASGALALYRLTALLDVAVDGEVFDEDFFSYKEDIDLAWRLRRRGWSCLYAPSALAFHYRAAGSPERAGNLKLASLHWNRSKFVNALSLRNHKLLLWKNESVINLLLHLPFIFWFEFRKWVWSLLFQPQALIKSYLQSWRLLPRMWHKRRVIAKNARCKAREMRKWFS